MRRQGFSASLPNSSGRRGKLRPAAAFFCLFPPFFFAVFRPFFPVRTPGLRPGQGKGLRAGKNSPGRKKAPEQEKDPREEKVPGQEKGLRAGKRPPGGKGPRAGKRPPGRKGLRTGKRVQDRKNIPGRKRPPVKKKAGTLRVPAFFCRCGGRSAAGGEKPRPRCPHYQMITRSSTGRNISPSVMPKAS